MASRTNAAGDMGLTRVSTDMLRSLLRHVHRDEISCPLTPDQLAPMGFQAESEWIMDTLRGLDARATRVVLTAVIAERMMVES